MGFHKRHIDNDQVVEMFSKEGTDKVVNWYESADAVICESGLASDIDDVLGLCNIDSIAKHNMINDLIFEYRFGSLSEKE